MRTLTVDDAIDELGVGRFHRRLLAVCGVTWAADAAEVLLLGFALPSVSRDFGLSKAQAGLLATSTFAGMLLGAWFWGAIADRVGRRRGFQLTVLVFAVFGTASAFAPDPVTLWVLRALAGFGLGGALPLDFALFSEYLPARRRGRWLVVLESFWAVGTLAAALLAWALVPHFGWRPLLATSALAALLPFWARVRVCESPRYLAATGRLEDAARVLRVVARRNGRPLPEGTLVAPPAPPRQSPAALWRPRLRRSTAMLSITWFALALGYYGVFSWLPKIFVDRGFGLFATYGWAALLALAQLPGYFSAAWLVERLGRRPTLAAYLAGSAAFTFAFAAVGGSGWIAATAVVMSFFTLGAWGALYAYTPELYPTEVRASGIGWASGMSRIAGVLAPLLGGLLLATSLAAALSLYGAALAAAAVAVAVLGRETREREPDAEWTDRAPARTRAERPRVRA